MVGAFKGERGRLHALDNIEQLFHEPYRTASRTASRSASSRRSSAGSLGFLIAYAAIREGTPRWIRTVLTTFSGVAANFAGIPLAFAFIATLGVARRRHAVHAQPARVSTPTTTASRSFAKTGVELVYLYFQIPLMILVIAPAIDGLRREWREAVGEPRRELRSSSGATSACRC